MTSVKTKPSEGNDFGAKIFSNPGELGRLARAKVDDPVAFARERAILRRQKVSIRDLDRAIAGRVAALIAERRELVWQGSDEPASPYFIAGGRIWIKVANRVGAVEMPLCNFTAQILADVSVDDGTERRRVLRIDGHLETGEQLGEVDVAADEFGRMEWVTPCWGVRATVNAGQGTRDHLRAALQLLSGKVPQEVVFTHTGWRQVGGVWVYLHAGGAIGGDGLVTGVRVCLPSQLGGYILPDPPSGEQLRLAVRASLGIFDGRLVPDQTAAVAFLAPYRAVVGGADYSLGLFGKTGAGKSELAALAQQHFGSALDARHLPATWSSTGNALESLAFHAKDALLVVDDYCPDNQDPKRLARDADRLLRGQGNQSGRNRLSADAALRPPKPPRGLVLTTGEDIPGGASLRARMWVVEVAYGSIDFVRLSNCQQDAAAGRYAAALAGFVRWLAADYPARSKALRAEAIRLRGELKIGGHNRAPSVAADLAATFALVMEYATAVGAVTPAEAEQYAGRAERAILSTAASQADHQREADPAERFTSLLRSVLSSGRGHLADRDGTMPDESDAPAAGWRKVNDNWSPLGRRIGWLDGQRVLLDPHASLAEVCRLADEQSSGFSVTSRTLMRLLHEAGLLAEVDGRGGRVRYTVRRTAEGSQKQVLVLAADLVVPPPEGGQSGQFGETQQEISQLSLATLADRHDPLQALRVATPLADKHSENGKCSDATRIEYEPCDKNGHTGHSMPVPHVVRGDNATEQETVTEEVL
jgi:hypothetical protein